MPRRVFVIAGPTAVGKSTLVRRLAELYPDLFVSVSATTRAPRPSETAGVDYHFVGEDDFASMIAHGQLLEWAEYSGKHYGTPRQPVVDAMAAGRTVILEIDLNGARQVRRSLPEAIQIFIAPPSWEELVRRLQARGAETPEQMSARLARAKIELASQDEFDHVVINDNISAAVTELVELLGL